MTREQALANPEILAHMAKTGNPVEFYLRYHAKRSPLAELDSNDPIHAEEIERRRVAIANLRADTGLPLGLPQ